MYVCMYVRLALLRSGFTAGAAHGEDHAQRLRHRGLPLRHRRLRGLREILAQSAQDGPVSTGLDGTDAIWAHVGTFTDIANVHTPRWSSRTATSSSCSSEGRALRFHFDTLSWWHLSSWGHFSVAVARYSCVLAHSWVAERVGPPSASREGSPRQCRAVATSNWFAVTRPLGPHRTRTPPRTFESRSTVIVLICTLQVAEKELRASPSASWKGSSGQ